MPRVRAKLVDSVRLTVDNGKPGPVVPAKVLGPFAIHVKYTFDPLESDPKTVRVTHVPTGLKVADFTGANKGSDAKRLVDILLLMGKDTWTAVRSTKVQSSNKAVLITGIKINKLVALGDWRGAEAMAVQFALFN